MAPTISAPHSIRSLAGAYRPLPYEIAHLLSRAELQKALTIQVKAPKKLIECGAAVERNQCRFCA